MVADARELLLELARWVAFASEAVVVAILAMSAALTLSGVALARMNADTFVATVERPWRRFRMLVSLALQFALAADVARSVGATGWEAIGKLAAIAAVCLLLDPYMLRGRIRLPRARQRVARPRPIV